MAGMSISTALLTVVAIMMIAILYVLSTRKSTYLTKADIEEFLNGGDSIPLLGNGTHLNEPYQKNLYEVSKNSFTIEEGSLLGSGNFGKVCRGTVINKAGTGERQEVAVKMTKVPCPRSAFRGILFEIKILSFLGKHPNLVELVGAYTAELRKCKAYVFLELCALGSLEGYLRKWKPASSRLSTTDSITGREQMTGFQLDDKLVQDMFRWAAEVANGMEYIASKHIVHLDIASRNVLLTADKLAKITDFGLSRRMYNYQTYVKTEQEPLPWRWMAPESLRRSEFSEKSDVWGFGVLLWEIFSLGDEPYPGLSFDFNFPSKLEKGLRLGEPSFSCNNIYSMMLRCWNKNPERRPPFSELARSFKGNQSSEDPGGCSEIGATKPLLSMSDPHTSNGILVGQCAQLEAHESINRDNKAAWLKEMGQGAVWLSFTGALITLIVLITVLAIYHRQNQNQAGSLATIKTINDTVLNSINQSDSGSTRFTTNSGRNLSLVDDNGNNNNDSLSAADVEPEFMSRQAWNMPEQKPNPGTKKGNEKKDEKLGLRLFPAIERGDKDAIKILIQFGAEPNVKNSFAETPLTRSPACSRLDFEVCLEIIKYLIDNGADAYARDRTNQTFLQKMVSQNGTLLNPSQFHQIVAYLISKNLSKIFNVPGGRSILPRAVDQIEVENRTLSLLYNNGVYLNALDPTDGYSPLMKALGGNRSLTLLNNLVEHGADWRMLGGEFNSSLLHFAECNADGLRYFIGKGLDVNAMNSVGNTPLHHIIKTGRGKILNNVRTLIENGGETEVMNNQGRTPLDEAVARKDLVEKNEIVQLLENIRTLHQDLFKAINTGDKETVQRLIQLEGAKVNARNVRMETPLLHSAGCKNNEPLTCLEIMKYLMDNGADISAKDTLDEIFLVKMVFRGSPFTPSQFHEITEYLLSENKSRIFFSPEGEKVLRIAVRDMEVESRTLSLLVKNGVDLNILDSNGNTLLMKALVFGKRSVRLLSDLIEHGVRPRTVNHKNDTLLHSAASQLNVEAIHLFLSKGLDVNAANFFGNTPSIGRSGLGRGGFWKRSVPWLRAGRMLRSRIEWG